MGASVCTGDPSIPFPELLFNAIALLLVGGAVARLRSGPTADVVAITGLALALAGGLVAFGISGRHFFLLARLLAYLLFLHLPLFLLGAGFSLARAQRRGPARACAGLVALAMLVFIYAFHVEPRWLEVTEIELRSAKLSDPLRILLVADIQTDRIGSYEEDVVRRMEELEPDLVLFAGDYVQHGDLATYETLAGEMNRLLRKMELAPRLGMYAVEGDIDRRGWPAVFEGTGVATGTVTTTLQLGEVSLSLLSVSDSRVRGSLLSERPGFHVVVGHAPDYALGPVSADLLLAGHTHGGQVQLPFIGPLVKLSRVPRSWASGATRLPSGALLVVSRGVGMERKHAPRLRFGARPELVLIEVRPEAEDGGGVEARRASPQGRGATG